MRSNPSLFLAMAIYKSLLSRRNSTPTAMSRGSFVRSPSVCAACSARSRNISMYEAVLFISASTSLRTPWRCASSNRRWTDNVPYLKLYADRQLRYIIYHPYSPKPLILLYSGFPERTRGVRAQSGFHRKRIRRRVDFLSLSVNSRLSGRKVFSRLFRGERGISAAIFPREHNEPGGFQ